MKKNKKVEKRVYKTNTKLLGKMLIAIVILFFIVILAVPVKNGITYLYLNSWEWHDISNYNIKFKLPRAYKNLETTKNNNLDLSSSLISTDTSIKVNENYVSKRPEIVYSGGNTFSGVSLMIQCLATPKTTKTLEEIADSQHVLVKIYYEDDYTIDEPKKEYVSVLGTDAIRTSTNLINKDGAKTIINYLVPMDNQEVTITFMGEQKNVQNAENEIRRIIEQMQSA
ncbi:MAG: hypothetical protein IJ220_01165 [Clostridia bacterium]|nr:hypothetical protein [Clostridia bacterium]